MSWSHNVKIGTIWQALENEDITVNESAKLIASKLRTLVPRVDNDGYVAIELEELCDDLVADAHDAESFDDVWERVYDWADRNRVWIDRS